MRGGDNAPQFASMPRAGFVSMGAAAAAGPPMRAMADAAMFGTQRESLSAELRQARQARYGAVMEAECAASPFCYVMVVIRVCTKCCVCLCVCVSVCMFSFDVQ